MPDQDFGITRLHRLVTDPHTVLRHDVDYDPTCAVKMAAYEASLNVAATYYIRPLYCYDEQDSQPFRQIFWYGHTIGVHPDLGLPREALVTEELLGEAAEELLQELMGEEIPVERRVSFHAPPTDVFWRNVPGFDHALNPNWFGRYIADSRGRWRTSPEAMLEWGQPIQINLHPEWYFWDQETADRWRVIEAAKP